MSCLQRKSDGSHTASMGTRLPAAPSSSATPAAKSLFCSGSTAAESLKLQNEADTALVASSAVPLLHQHPTWMYLYIRYIQTFPPVLCQP